MLICESSTILTYCFMFVKHFSKLFSDFFFIQFLLNSIFFSFACFAQLSHYIIFDFDCQAFSQLFWNFLFHSLLSIRFCWFASQQLVYHITTVIALSSDFQNFFQRIFCRFCNHSAELFCLSPVPSQQLAYLITSDIIMSSVFKKFFEQFSSNFLSFLRGS